MKPRAGIYTRYSSDLQNPKSCADQLRECKREADKRGFEVVADYSDAGISGSHLMTRPGVNQLVDDARAGRFEVVMIEALDRLSRNLGDVAKLYERLTHHGIRILSLAEGEINEMHIGLKGTMNALFLKDMAAKTRRGMKGRIEAGKAAGGKSYGYRVVRRLDAEGNLVTGEREIVEDEARIVRRIFESYIAGMSARKIAAQLNAERVPGPRGGQWNASTVGGHAKRGTGILQNELYVGRLIFNRSRFAKDPDSARRTSKLNDKSEWTVGSAPHLRIIDDETWQAAQAVRRQLSSKGAPQLSRRPRHFLSGLLRCGTCGGPMAAIGPYFGCSWHRERGPSVCANGRRLRRDLIQAAVADKLETGVLDPDDLERAVKVEIDRAAELNRTAAKRIADLKRKRARLDAQCNTIVQAIKAGMLSPRLREEFETAEREIADLDREIAEAAQPKVTSLHPNAVREVVAEWLRLMDAIRAGEDVPKVRRLLVEVKALPVTAKRGGDWRITLTARLDDLLEIVLAEPFVLEKARKSAGSRVSLTRVAGRRFGQTLHSRTISWLLLSGQLI